LDFTNKLYVIQARRKHEPIMKEQDLVGRVGDLLRKYTKTFPKRLGKDTKNLLCYMIVFWSEFDPGTAEYTNEASEFQSNLSTCNFSTQLKRLWYSSVYKYSKFIETKIIYGLITHYTQPSYNCITFLSESFNIVFLCVSRKLHVRCFRKPDALLPNLP
jgi:hypothetical protein